VNTTSLRTFGADRVYRSLTRPQIHLGSRRSMIAVCFNNEAVVGIGATSEDWADAGESAGVWPLLEQHLACVGPERLRCPVPHPFAM
jgi:type IV secretory pathway TrbD component